MRDHGKTKSTQETMARLYAQYSPAVRAYLRSRCRCHHLAEDITSDVFVSATQALRSKPKEDITLAWLITVAKWRLTDHWRQEGRRHRLDLALKAAESIRPRCGQEDTVSNDIHRLLSPVPERQQSALALRYVVGFSVGEVASRMGVSYQCAESLLARGRRSLATSLSAA